MKVRHCLTYCPFSLLCRMEISRSQVHFLQDYSPQEFIDSEMESKEPHWRAQTPKHHAASVCSLCFNNGERLPNDWHRVSRSSQSTKEKGVKNQSFQCTVISPVAGASRDAVGMSKGEPQPRAYRQVSKMRPQKSGITRGRWDYQSCQKGMIASLTEIEIEDVEFIEKGRERTGDWPKKKKSRFRKLVYFQTRQNIPSCE